MRHACGDGQLHRLVHHHAAASFPTCAADEIPAQLKQSHALRGRETAARRHAAVEQAQPLFRPRLGRRMPRCGNGGAPEHPNDDADDGQEGNADGERRHDGIERVR
jgi:hypothetical protein